MLRTKRSMVLLTLGLVVTLLTAAAPVLNAASSAAQDPRNRVSGARTSPVTTAPTATTSRLSNEIVISAIDNEQFLPAVAYNWKHREYLVVWHNTWAIGSRDIRGQRVSSNGALIGGEFSVSEGLNDRAQASVAYDPVNDRYLVVWTFDALGSGFDWDVWGRFVPWNGPSASLTEFQISKWTSHQWNPQVAYGRAQEEFLVVWTNVDPQGLIKAYISGRRIKASDGSFPGGTGGGFTIASHLSENRVNPDVTYNLARNEYLVTYDNVFDIFGVRLRGDGFALGGGEFGIAGWPDQEEHPAVAACDKADQYLVAWQSLVASHYDIYARFVNGDGTPATVQLVYGTAANDVEPDVACNVSGDGYLVVWQEQYSNTTGPYGVSGRLVFPSAEMGPPFGIVAPFGGGKDRSNPAVVGGNSNYLTAWEHGRDGTAFQDIRGRLIAPFAVFLPITVRNLATP